MAAAQKDADGDTSLKGASKPSAQDALTQPVLPPMRVLEEDDEFEEFEEEGESASVARSVASAFRLTTPSFELVDYRLGREPDHQRRRKAVAGRLG